MFLISICDHNVIKMINVTSQNKSQTHGGPGDSYIGPARDRVHVKHKTAIGVEAKKGGANAEDIENGANTNHILYR